MEIINDLSRTLSFPVRNNVQGKSPSQTSQVMADNQQITAVPARKDLINALNLMQTASGIVQEALNASSKLRSLAISSIFSGHADYNEVANSLAGIRSTLQQYGRQLTSPQITEPDPIPDVNHELDIMGKMAGEKAFSKTELSSVEEKLQNMEEDVKSRISLIEKKLGFSKSDHPEESVSIRDLTHSISNHFGEALTAQGNIRPETIKSLI
jgi:hypothetical protein